MEENIQNYSPTVMFHNFYLLWNYYTFLQVKIIKVDIWSPVSNTVLVEPRPREEQPGFSSSQEIPESSGENPQNATNSSLNLRSLDGDMSEGTGK